MRPLRECVAAIGPAAARGHRSRTLLFNVNTPEDLLQAAAMLDLRASRPHPATD